MEAHTSVPSLTFNTNRPARKDVFLQNPEKFTFLPDSITVVLESSKFTLKEGKYSGENLQFGFCGTIALRD
jgi:hypothetical protein